MVNQLTVNTDTMTGQHQIHNPKDTYNNDINNNNSTPQTAASTPTTATYNTVRGRSDIRSPGISKTPSIVKPQSSTPTNAPNTPPSPTSTTEVPDFITQTDKYGNASTPRTPSVLSTAAPSSSSREKSEDADNEELQYDYSGQQEHPVDREDACDTLLESLRMMCCCLLPDTSHDLTRSGQASMGGGIHSHNHSGGATVRKLQITKQRRAKGEGAIYGHIDETSKFHAHATQHIKLLPDILPEDQGKPCLVLDLDETLVHSSFRAVPGADFVIPVQIEDVVHYVYVAKRPGVDEFLVEMAKYYEVILYTASLNKYADPLLDLLDPHRTIRTRLFRESCVFYEGNYVKDLSLLDRDLTKTIIVDNSPSSYIFHPQNAIDCTSFIDDPTDVELEQIGSFLKDIRNVKDVRTVCGLWKEWPNINISAAEEGELVETRQDKAVQ